MHNQFNQRMILTNQPLPQIQKSQKSSEFNIKNLARVNNTLFQRPNLAHNFSSNYNIQTI